MRHAAAGSLSRPLRLRTAFTVSSDFSIFKEFPVTETMHFEFRAESFNLTNTPSFALPGTLNYLNTVSFGQISSTRDAPNDAREAF